MDKLLNILSELPITNKYMSIEIEEIELLSNKASESIRANQENCDDVEYKSKEIEILKEEEQALFTKIKDRENEFAVAIEKLEDLQREYGSLARIDDNDFGWSEKEILKKLDYQMKLFGINIKAQYLEPTVYQAKINFSEDKFVIFNCDIIRNTYDLQAMEPRHRHCEEMRRLLLESRDIVGFLCHVWKFFCADDVVFH